MKITLLGTGTSQGVPVIACDCNVCLSKNKKDKRLRTSAMIEVNNEVFIIDTGPDFRQQMLSNNVNNISGVFFTHHHKDHVAGMDDIRAFNYKWRKDVNIYCNYITEKALYNEFPYVFVKDKYPGVPKVNINLFSNKEFYVNDTKIIPIKAKHYKLTVFGFRINNFVYLTDVSEISVKEKQKLYNADLIVLDALRKEKHISHFSLEEALSLLDEVKPKKAVLTHISHYMGLHDEVNKELPKNIKLGFDNQVFNL
jgi:phosphoribosyl 1,2-cyclic phosphate phosphodiesterase